MLRFGLNSGAKRLDAEGSHHEVRKFADVIEGQHELAQSRPGPKQSELNRDPDIIDLDLLLVLLGRLSYVRIQGFLDVAKDQVLLLSCLLHLISIEVRHFDLELISKPGDWYYNDLLPGAQLLIDVLAAIRVFRIWLPGRQQHIKIELAVDASYRFKNDLGRCVHS